MKVKILRTCRVSGKQLTEGQSIELADEAAKTICCMGKAEPVKSEPIKPKILTTETIKPAVQKPAEQKKQEPKKKPVKKGKK